jgi:REP element-mobilizing transposase RayT
MANTYTSLHYHFTFSTKNREPWITNRLKSAFGHTSVVWCELTK